MASPQYIRAFLLNYFKNTGKVGSAGNELSIPSLFYRDDWKCHMNINLNTGMWQDFKTGNKGNFTKLVSLLRGITYKEAVAEVEFHSFSEGDRSEPPPEKKCDDEVLSFTSVTLESYNSENRKVLSAWVYLFDRGLFRGKGESNTFYIIENGPEKYNDRVIIPFFTKDKKFEFFQARTMVGDHPKYLNNNPPNIHKSNLLYPFDSSAEYVVVCEGPIDAISLQNAGVNATCTMGCSISRVQMELLIASNCNLVCGYDNDAAGQHGLENMERLRKKLRAKPISVCRPPAENKDWNSAFCAEINLPTYIKDNTKLIDFDFIIDELMID